MPSYKSKADQAAQGIAAVSTYVANNAPTYPGLFEREDQQAAMAEGWWVGWDSEEQNYDILDNLTLTFATSAEARAWVVKRSDEGSDLHSRALAACVAFIIRKGATK